MEQLASDAPAVSVMHFSTSFFKKFYTFLSRERSRSVPPVYYRPFPVSNSFVFGLLAITIRNFASKRHFSRMRARARTHV